MDWLKSRVAAVAASRRVRLLGKHAVRVTIVATVAWGVGAICKRVPAFLEPACEAAGKVLRAVALIFGGA